MSMVINPNRFGPAPVIGTYVDPTQLAGPGGANITLSNGNLTAEKSAVNSVAHAIAKHGKLTGKWRYQVTYDTAPISGGELGVGVVGPLFNRNSYQGVDNQGAGMVSDGRQGTNGAYAASGLGAWTVGDVLDVYVDADARKVWFGKNGVFSGDPTAGTGGVSLGSAVRAFYPNLYMHGGSGKLTANFSGPFTHNLHPAYGGWSAQQTTDRDTFRAAMIYIRSAGYFAHCVGEFFISTTSGGSNMLTGGTANARASSSGNVPAYAIDGNSATWWEDIVNGGSGQGPSYLSVDLGSNASRLARYLAIQARAGSGGEQLQAPTLFDLYFSPDNVSWEKAAIGLTFSAFPPQTPGLKQEIAIPAF